MVRKIEIVLAALLVALIGVNIILYFSRDKKPPEITFSVSPVYYEGDDESVLLGGVSAYDNKDGDVSASLVVDHFIESDDGSTITVYYAARDKSNNVSKASRRVEVRRVVIPEPVPVEEPVENEED